MQAPDAAETLRWLREHEFRLGPEGVREDVLFRRVTKLR